MATKSQKNVSWGGIWVIVGILAIALLLPLVVKVGGDYYRWGFEQKENQEIVCPECPDCVCPSGKTVGDTIITEPEINESDYVCKAIKIGGPVGQAGTCNFCTVNYTKPGNVWIAGEEYISYTSEAWVFQYPKDDLEGFLSCINEQDFVTKLELGYIPIWP